MSKTRKKYYTNKKMKHKMKTNSITGSKMCSTVKKGFSSIFGFLNKGVNLAVKSVKKR